MPELVIVLWLPVCIAAMAVTWVFTLGALGQVQTLPAETRHGTREEVSGALIPRN